MRTRLTAKLFHTVVVLGVGLTAGCSSSGEVSEPNNQTPASAGSTPAGGSTSGTPAPADTDQPSTGAPQSEPTNGAPAKSTGTQTVADAGTDAGKPSTSSSSSSGDAFPGWLCCG